MDNPLNPLESWFRANQGRQVNKWPHYFRIYDRHFARFRGTAVNVVEFGVQHGGSLEMWRDYFGPRCRVTGVDIDPRCAGLGGERISVVTGDQEDREFLRALASVGGQPDVVIDDGGHSMGQQIATFEEMWPWVRDGGVFLAEDVHTSYWSDYGGGYRKPGTFIEYAKDLIDRMNAWHSEDSGSLEIDRYTRSVAGIHFYDSIVVFDKDTVTPPARPEVTGHASW
jgi:cephalosporin hydroxylase